MGWYGLKDMCVSLVFFLATTDCSQIGSYLLMFKSYTNTCSKYKIYFIHEPYYSVTKILLYVMWFLRNVSRMKHCKIAKHNVLKYKQKKANIILVTILFIYLFSNVQNVLISEKWELPSHQLLLQQTLWMNREPRRHLQQNYSSQKWTSDLYRT